MAITTAEEIYLQIKSLPAREQLQLVEKVVHDLAAQSAEGTWPRRRWSEIRGLVAYPMYGEDAQDWVSRTRREADGRREKQWRHTPRNYPNP